MLNIKNFGDDLMLKKKLSKIICSSMALTFVASAPIITTANNVNKSNSPADTGINKSGNHSYVNGGPMDVSLANEEKIIEILEENNIDLIVLAGYMSILSADFTRRYERRIINVHPSLIPSFCGEGFYGLRVHEAALKKGVKVTGATVHFVNEIPDGGEIIMQKAVKVRDGDTPETLQKRVMRLAEWKILPAAAEKISDEIVRKKAEEK